MNSLVVWTLLIVPGFRYYTATDRPAECFNNIAVGHLKNEDKMSVGLISPLVGDTTLTLE